MVTSGRAARLAQRLLAAVRDDLVGFRVAVASRFPIATGLFAYRVRPPGGSRRIHLRIERDGSGVLLVDLSDVVHLNATAARLAKMALDGAAPKQAIAALRGRSRGMDPTLLRREVRRIYGLVEHLSTTTDACPTCGLGQWARTPPGRTPVLAPYKADLALTYGCNNACRHCYNQHQRNGMPSLSLGDWRRVLEKLRRIGVPQIIFTGGESTLRDGLPDLIRWGEQLGLVTGLNTNGRRLADASFTRSLARAGLSHVQITLESHRRDVHNAMTRANSFDETVRGIQNALDVGLHTITNTTLTRRNVDHAERIVEFLHRLGLRTFGVNGMIYSGGGRTSPDAIAEEDLEPVLVGLRDRAAELGMRMLWYTPTAYCRLSPVDLELAPRRCNAAEYSICIEPNGDVLPCQSYYTSAGNILRDRWDTIWSSPLFRSFRDRAADPPRCDLPEQCWECPDLSLCGGGCRIERENGRLQIEDCGMTTPSPKGQP